MKSCLLVASLLILLLNNLFGEIKNGYEKNVPGLKVSLQSLMKILHSNQDLSKAQKRSIKKKIESIINYMAYYEITDRLLKQFQTISPDLYREIETLTDCKGRIIDVYVKFIPKEEAQVQAGGLTSFEQAANDLNSCNSEYGENSVSIRICMLNNALRVLSHEFGHVKYLVPNLKSYVEFYRRKYRAGSGAVLGHCAGDQSGKIAMEYEQRFRANYARYLKQESNRFKSPMALFSPIKKGLSETLLFQ